MKSFRFSAFVLMLGLVSCVSTQKAYKQENYDVVINNLSEEVLSNEVSGKQLDMFANAYHKANQLDFNRIIELKKSAQPDIWNEVYWRTYNIWQRNVLVGKCNEQQKAFIGYKSFDMDKELASCRNKAEAYIVRKLEVYIQSEDIDKEESQSLIYQLNRLNPNSSALSKITPKVLIKNSAETKIESKASAALNIPKDYHSFVLDFKSNSKKPELTICIVTTKINVSPERCDKVSFEEKNNGSIAKVTDNKLSKSATISGSIMFYKKGSKEIVYKMPFEVSSSFNYGYTTIEGDSSACSEQTLNMEHNPIPYPTNNSLIVDAAKKLNQVVKQEFGLQ